MALSILYGSRLARARCDFAVVALLGITASLILAGCGGSGSSGDSSDTPILNILSPVNGASYVDGESVPFRGTASDPQDGELTGDSLVWRTATGLELGTGGAFQIDALALGQHTIILTATDAGGIAATKSVTIRIVEPPADPEPRFGETSPYAGRISRTPAKLDDELVVVGRASSVDQVLLGVVDDPVSAYEPDNPSGPSVAPREVLRRDGVAPLAAAAGRVIGSNVQQVVMLSRATPLTGSGAVTLEVLGLYPGQERMLIARQALSMPYPAAPVGITVADVDAFDEVSGDKVLDATSVSDETAYHDEAVLAYPEMVSGALRARVRVLSFEDVDFPESAGDPVPGPTSDTGILTSAPMRPSSRIVVAHGDQLTGTTTGPHIVVAYVDVAGSVAVDVFEYQHTRADPANPDPRTDMRVLVPVPEYQHAVLGPPLSDAAVLAGGWDLVVARANTFGMDMVSGDVLLVVSQGNGQYSEAAWKLEDLAGFPGPYQLASQTGEFGRVSDGAGGEIPLSILADSPLRAVRGGGPFRARRHEPRCDRAEHVGLH